MGLPDMFFAAGESFFSTGYVTKVYSALAIAGSILFGLTLIFSLAGAGGLDEADFDVDSAAPVEHPDTGMLDFKILSVRSVLAFMTVFGWGGVLWGHLGLKGFLVALFCGLFTMFMTAYLVYLVMKLQGDANVRSCDFIGKEGSVYVGIPGGEKEEGKVVVCIGGATHELKALADENIPSGTAVKIVASAGNRRYKVEKISGKQGER